MRMGVLHSVTWPRLARLALLALAAAAAGPTAAAPAAEDGLEATVHLASVARESAARESGRPPAELEVGAIDPRLRLAACAAPLTGRLTPGTRSSTQLTVEVRCESPPWRHFVAVRVRAQEPVVVAARPVGRLQAVSAEDVAVVTRDLSTVPAGYFRRAEDVVGRIAQRTIGSGEVLVPALVRAPPIVRRGQSVTVIAHAGAMSVRASGVVQADAGLAERVQVRNTATGRTVEGVVRSGDTVEVSLE
jgi:flagella basal body P-ring formation protein FlgA